MTEGTRIRRGSPVGVFSQHQYYSIHLECKMSSLFSLFLIFIYFSYVGEEVIKSKVSKVKVSYFSVVFEGPNGEMAGKWVKVKYFYLSCFNYVINIPMRGKGSTIS